MTINGKRTFKYNGRKYRIENMYKQDAKPGMKYFITAEDENGLWKSMYNTAGWNIEQFRTIKDAQRFVRAWDFMLESMY